MYTITARFAGIVNQSPIDAGAGRVILDVLVDWLARW
jgi:hypothetical protein